MKWPSPLPKIKDVSPLCALGLSLLMASCATTANYKTVKLPAYAGAYFSECTGKDGSVSIEMYESGKVQQIFDADWSADDRGDIGLASYSPLGQTLFQLDYSHKTKAFRQSGKPFKVFENLTVGKQNILEIDGHEIGLRSDEIGCLLNQRLPQRWLKRIVDEKSDSVATRYTILDADRKITVSLPKNSNRSEERWSATIDWSLYWGFKTLALDIRLLKSEQALVLHASQFDKIDVRVIAQEE